MNKLTEVLKSQNFLITLFAIISPVLAYNNIDLETSPQDIAASLTGVPLGVVFTTVIGLLLNPAVKIAKRITEKKFNFGFFKSWNFWVQTGSAVLLLVGAYFDELDAVNAILGTVLANTTNLVYHTVIVPPKLSN